MRLLTGLALAASLLVPLGMGRPASGQDPGAPAASPAAQPPAPSGLDLSIRARALGVVPPSVPPDALGVDRMKAPTGAGTTRMPSATTELAPGVYMTVMPSCGPEDELMSLRRSLPGRRR